MFVMLLFVGLVTNSRQTCSKNFFPPLWDEIKKSQIINKHVDKSSGCSCNVDPKVYTVCYGKKDCSTFPKTLNFTAKTFVLRSSRVVSIKPGDLMKVRHVECLIFKGNSKLNLISNDSFCDLRNLRHLSISENKNLSTLELNIFKGVRKLEKLKIGSNGFMKLSEVTAVLRNLTVLVTLDLSENQFQQVDKNDFESLQNSSLQELSLKSCQIKHLEEEAFTFLRKLRVLHLEGNKIKASDLSLVIQRTTNLIPLDLLNLCSIGLSKKDSLSLLKSIARTNITKLCLTGNELEDLNSETVPPMPNIRILDLSEVQVLNIASNVFAGFYNLKTLLLRGNQFTSFPKDFRLENLTFLDLQQNTHFDSTNESFTTMPSLVNISMNSMSLAYLYNATFVGLENLKRLELNNSTIYGIATNTFIPLSKLEFLDLQNNLFATEGKMWQDKSIFTGLNNLRELLLGGCQIEDLNNRMFENLTKLEYLGLERNKLVVLNDFGVLASLQRINLSTNMLHPWHKSVFFKNRHLEEINVSGNKLTHLTSTMVQEFSKLKKLDLENNIFHCDCLFAWNTTKLLRLIKNQTLPCTSPDSAFNLTVIQFFQDHTCFNYTLVISLVIFIVFITVTVLSVYLLRWHLRYWLFLTKLHLRRTLKVHTSNEVTGYINYIYDAFISYSSEDRDFVRLLIKMLENHPPYIHLCVYERDFEIGTMISDNILESVAKSRKTVLIITEAYVKSQWCRLECQIAEFNRLFRRNRDGKYVNDNVIVIKLGVINDAHLTPMLKYLLRTRIYLQWDENPKKQAVFWEKLRKVLAPPSTFDESTNHL